jgi:hypothetical protein
MRHVLLPCSIMLGSILASAIPALAQPAQPIRLITVEEANLPPSAEAGAPERNMTRGPAIDRVAPSAIGVDGPFRFAVRFKPRNGVPIDPASVRVTYLRQPSVDLTPRLKAFVTADGIDALAVVAPPGKHVVEIEATDKEGRVGRGRITLTVDAPK